MLRSGFVASLVVLGLVAPLAAIAAQAPSIGKVTVAERTADGLVIKATVNPYGSTTAVRLRFGTSPSLGRRSSPVTVTAAGGRSVVTMTLAQLKAGRTYYYRFAATNGAGTKTTKVRSVKTTEE